MNDSTKSVSPLRQRMIEGMIMRKPKTQLSYIRHVVRLGEYLGRSPHAAITSLKSTLSLCNTPVKLCLLIN